MDDFDSDFQKKRYQTAWFESTRITGFEFFHQVLDRETLNKFGRLSYYEMANRMEKVLNHLSNGGSQECSVIQNILLEK